jgi:dTMP kinase
VATVAEEIAALRGTRRATLRDLLTDPSFSRLWRAMLVSSLGDWVGFVAVAALVARIGGQRLGGLAVSGVMVARLLPSVVFGPFAGVFVDRFDRRKVMIGADIARGSLYASMPFLPKLWLIFLVSFVIECLSLLWTPAKDASVPNLVSRRQLPNANSVGLVTTYGTLPLGATIFTGLAGLALAIGGSVHYFGSHPESLALWLDAVTFLFSARMVWGLKFRPTVAGRTREAERPKLNLTSAVDEVRQGVSFLRRHPLIASMTIGIVVAFGGAGSVISLGPIFARYSLNAPATGFGILMIALGIGMAGGMASMGLLTKLIDNTRLFHLALLATPLFLFVLAAMPKLWLAALFTVPLGFGAGLAWVTGYTVLQENTSDEFRGRTFATLTVMARLALFVALAGFPALATAIGPRVFHIGGQVLQHAEIRIALWVGAAIAMAGAARTGRGIKRHRLARPIPLRLVPKILRGDRPGIFIVFEGVEGAGKGTQIELAREYLERKGRDVVVTREPGGTPLGDHIRAALLDPETGKIEPRAEALLFAASRSHHVATVIRPALEKGKVVLCDRFIDSSVAYQGAGRGLGEGDLLTLNAWATQGLFPDLVVLLHLEPDVGLARSGAVRDRIESEEPAFHVRVAEAFLRIADEHPERYIVVDSSTPPDVVHRQVRLALDRVLRTASPPSR